MRVGRSFAWRALALALVTFAPATQAGVDTQAGNPPGPDWTVTVLASQSALSGDQASWRDGFAELLYQPTANTYGGARLEARERNHETDLLYTALISHMPARTLEVHGSVTLASDPAFSAEQAYQAGLEWRAHPRVSALLDRARLEFAVGTIEQVRPGAVWWFTEQTFLTYRYTYGRAYDEVSFDAHGLRLDLGAGGPWCLALSAMHGTDPDKGLPGVLLSKADAFAAYGQWRFRRNLTFILGAEYEDRHDAYTRITGAGGLVLRF